MSTHNKEAQVASFAATIQYGVVTIQGLLAGNGGGVTALFALKGGNDLHRYVDAAAVFASGFVFALVCSFCSYFSQGLLTRSAAAGAAGAAGSEDKAEDKAREWGSKGMKWRSGAIIFGLFSLACLVGGGVLSFSIAMYAELPR
ncbi:hypothetical protein [Telmatospirillum sp. J64-1]|uniref:hypothetical protein n=1 Tax=Telmatospirillum sp. J64-1 TaxID=2502183 RepID=UPI00115DD204|nr:hypothetical protein [Telmatospirillum sp. J64-1]